jgi:hypothetical protein
MLVELGKKADGRHGRHGLCAFPGCTGWNSTFANLATTPIARFELGMTTTIMHRNHTMTRIVLPGIPFFIFAVFLLVALGPRLRRGLF